MSSDSQFVSSSDRPPPSSSYPMNPRQTQKITRKIKTQIRNQIRGKIDNPLPQPMTGHWLGTLIAFLTLLLPLLAVIQYSSGQPRDFTPSGSTVNLTRLGGYESVTDP